MPPVLYWELSLGCGLTVQRLEKDEHSRYGVYIDGLDGRF